MKISYNMTFSINQFKDERRTLLAEDIGFHIGDGHMSISNRKDKCDRYSFTYCGDKNNDYEYFSQILIPRKKILFSLLKTNVRKGNDSCIYFCYNSKQMFEFFKRMGIPSGKKDRINIPKWIMKDNLKIKAACLRGLVDSDGCFTVKKRHKSFPYYPVVSLQLKSGFLVKDIKQILFEMDIGFTSCFLNPLDKRTGKRHSKYEIDINGRKRVRKWVYDVGFNNPRHIKKYKRWAGADSQSSSIREQRVFEPPIFRV